MADGRVIHARPELFAAPNHGFAWIRMIGALLVIYGHSSPLVGTGELFPPEWPLQPDEGVLMGFFALSGFQITESWMRDPHPARFAVKRVLRLWPPMLTVSVGMALIVGPMVTVTPVGEYFSDPNTWEYIVSNAGLLTLQHDLPGVFANNPWPDAVNGSLWTLPMELVAYVGLYVLLLLGAAKQRTRWLAVVALCALVVWDRHLEHDAIAESAGALVSVPVESLVAFLVAFAIGVVLNVYRIPLSPTAAIAALVVMFLMPNSHTGSFWMTIAVSYAVIVTGHFWPAQLTVPGVWVNGSYGVYVWSFPIQQLLAMAGIPNQYLMVVCAAPIAYVLGTLSWKFIEEPTMQLRHYITPEPKQQVDDEDDWDDADWDDVDWEDEDWEEDWDGEDWEEDWDRHNRNGNDRDGYDWEEPDPAPPTQVMRPIPPPPVPSAPAQPAPVSPAVPRRQAPPPVEESVLARRLSGTLDGSQQARQRPPVRSANADRPTGRHARVDPADFEEQTRPTIRPVARRKPPH